MEHALGSAPRRSIRDRVIAWGGWLFRLRSWTPIPLIAVLLLCGLDESPDLYTWPPGLLFILMGEGLRLWGVSVVGKESRTRGSGTGRLVTHGPYAFVRNPLYVGNLLLTLGATCLSELLWMIPIVVILYLVQYIPIVLWEEQNLTRYFGPAYDAYCRRVPRWIPKLSRHWRGPLQWRAAFRSERSTLTTLAVLLALMLAKEDLGHLLKYWHKHSLSIGAGVWPSHTAR